MNVSLLVSWWILLSASLPPIWFLHSCWLLFSASNFSLHFELAMQRCESLWLHSVNKRPSNRISENSAWAETFLATMDLQPMPCVKSRRGVWKTERLGYNIGCHFFNRGGDLIGWMFAAWWSVSQCSVAVTLNNSIEFHTKYLIQYIEPSLSPGTADLGYCGEQKWASAL